MARIGLVHFYTLGSTFIQKLDQAQLFIQFASVPHFAQDTVDFACLNLYNKDVFLFDIASWNQYDPVFSLYDPSRENLLNDRERLQLIIQSERLDHLAELSIADRFHLLSVIINKSISLLETRPIDVLFLEVHLTPSPDCALYYVARSLGIPSVHFSGCSWFFPEFFLS